jgi:pyruvate kinase
MRRTRIIATIGPASNTPETIARLLEAGMDVARLNFSHGTHEYHAHSIALLREAAREAGRPLAILQDLQGPKIRTGPLTDGQPVQLVAGTLFAITTKEMTAGTASRVSTTYKALPRDVHRGDRILISDGLIELQVLDTSEDEVQTEVVVGGELREKQGINLPGVNVSSPSLTMKDVLDLEFGLEHEVDYIALSFVRRADDIVDIKERIAAAGKNTPVVAKIEKPEALDDLDEILRLSDAVMVARGDLGVEIPTEQVPPVQKQIIEACNQAGIPVITATQMLDSMIRNPRPTRAEASDVANAIFDGTDAVMLSGETASGNYPVASVRMMASIIEAAEKSGRQQERALSPVLHIEPDGTIAQAISAATRAIVAAMPIHAIVALTLTGNTARLVSRQRPAVPILACTPWETTYRRMNLLWGVTPVMVPYTDRLLKVSRHVYETLVSNHFANPDDMVILIGGHPLATLGSTNFIKIVRVDSMDTTATEAALEEGEQLPPTWDPTWG